MSNIDIVQIECPDCHDAQEVTVWYALNTDLDPQAKEELIKGNINLFCCQKCSAEALIPIELLYHDMERRFCVRYFPPERLDDESFFEDFTIDGHLSSPYGKTLPRLVAIAEKTSPYFKSTHVVFSMEELIRYIKFRDKLWERG